MRFGHFRLQFGLFFFFSIFWYSCIFENLNFLSGIWGNGHHHCIRLLKTLKIDYWNAQNGVRTKEKRAVKVRLTVLRAGPRVATWKHHIGLCFDPIFGCFKAEYQPFNSCNVLESSWTAKIVFFFHFFLSSLMFLSSPSFSPISPLLHS